MYMSFSTIPYLKFQTNHEFVRHDLSAPAIFFKCGRVRWVCVDTLVTFSAEAEARIFTLSWIARVPSYSNCADPPSRGEISNLIRMNAIDSSNAKLIVLEVLARMNKNKGEMA